MGVEVFHDDVVITEVKKKVKAWCEIRRTGRDRGGVNVMSNDGDIVNGGCNGEVLNDEVIREEVVGGEVDEGDVVMNEYNQSSTTRVTFDSFSAFIKLFICMQFNEERNSPTSFIIFYQRFETTCLIFRIKWSRMVFTDSGIVWELVDRFFDDLSLDYSCIHVIRMFFE